MINILPQQEPHDDGALIITPDELNQLKTAIRLLQEGKTKNNEIKIKTFSSDGEGFDFIIQVLPEEQIRSADPYYASEDF